MIPYSVALAQPWHCGAIVRRLRTEQAAIAIGLGRNAHHDLRMCFDNSGFSRSWVRDNHVHAIMGVSGPLLAPEGMIWLALSDEVVRHPRQVVKEVRKTLNFLMTIKNRIYGAPFESDPTSIRFAEFFGFVRCPDNGTAMKGTVPMVLANDIQAYVGRYARVN